MKPQIVVFAIFMLLSTPLGAQESDAQSVRVANEISHQVLSPFCPGKTLAMCPSPAAAEVRMQIQGMAESGMSDTQIKEAILAEHGEEFRIVEPPATDDFGLLGALGGGLALAVLALVIISRRRSPDAGEPKPEPTDEPEDPDEPDDEYLSDLRKQYRG